MSRVPPGPLPSARRALAVLALALPVVAAPWHGSKSTDELTRAFYDLEVTAYCGLANAAVRTGFEREIARLKARDDVDEASLGRARTQAWKEAHLEWQNRGLGGFRSWCRSEGRAAAERFTRAGSD